MITTKARMVNIIEHIVEPHQNTCLFGVHFYLQLCLVPLQSKSSNKKGEHIRPHVLNYIKAITTMEISCARVIRCWFLALEVENSNDLMLVVGSFNYGQEVPLACLGQIWSNLNYYSKLSFLDILQKWAHSLWCTVVPLGPHSNYTWWEGPKAL